MRVRRTARWAALCGVVLACSPLALSSAAGATEQVWRDTSLAPDERADLLLAAMAKDEKVRLVLATNDEDFGPLKHLGIPQMRRVDASGGLRGDTGVTAFPAPNALGASFDTELAREYGAVIGREAHAKRWNVVLGPTVDIDRNGLSGRAAEGYGEDPLVNGAMGAAVSAGIESEGSIAMLKHYGAYAQESGPRETLAVEVSDRALRELYYPPFEQAIREGGADSVMCAYPKINGVYACENSEMLGLLKSDLGLDGYVATDFAPRSEWVAGFNAGVDSQSLYAQGDWSPFYDGRISDARLDEAAYRMLLALFDSGAYDNPLPETAVDVATDDAHQALAVRTGEEASVLLRNEGALPLSTTDTVAVIGPSGSDAITGIEGSSYVDPGDFVTAAEAITAKAGSERTVVSQGSLGDVTLPTVPADAFDGALTAEYFSGTELAGDPLATGTVDALDFTGPPVDGLPSAWSARFTGTITPTETGLVRFSSLLSGSAKVVVDGQTAFDDSRFAWDFFFAPQEYTLGGVVELTAGVPVEIQVEYSTRGAGYFGQRLTLGWQPESLIPAAVEVARGADVAVVFANEFTGEAVDRIGLSLPGDQNALIEAVAAVNPNTIVVLHTPGPVLMPWLDDVEGVVQAWYQGTAIGQSIANVLYGDAEPGGRLPMTFPASADQGPQLVRDSGSVTYDEGIFVGYKWFEQQQAVPLFPFGYGLSYTDFAYSDLEVVTSEAGAAAERIAAPAVTVRATVTNVGDRAGSDVVQAYVGHLPTDAVDTVGQALAGFAKVDLEPGASERVEISVDPRVLSYWDETGEAWVTPEGAVPLSIGASAADVALTGVIDTSAATAPEPGEPGQPGEPGEPGTGAEPGDSGGPGQDDGDTDAASPAADAGDDLVRTGSDLPIAALVLAVTLILAGAGIVLRQRARSRRVG